MKLLFIACLTFLSCGCANQYATTRCGLIVEQTDWLTLQSVQEAEDATVQAMTESLDPELRDATANCAALKGVVVTGRPQWWVHTRKDGEKLEVVGLADCEVNHVQVARPPHDTWQFGSLPHELVHIMQRCTPLEHENWRTDHIYKLLTDIHMSAVPEDTR